MVFYPNTQIKDPFANEPVPMKIPSSGQVMEDPRIQRNVQAYMDKLNADAARGQAIRDTLAREPYISPTENVRPLNPEIEERVRDAVFNPREDNSFNDRIVEAYQRKMLGPSDKISNEELVSEAQIKQPEAKKGNSKPASKKEQFKAKAKKSVRDWTDNSGMHYIANVNPYAAAGMGFANQMANPFKQRYFESRADANEEEDARRLNYEIGRQAKLDKAAEEERKRQREIEDYIPSVEAPSTLGVRGVDVDGFNKDISDILARKDISAPVKRQMIAERVAKIRKEVASAERGFNFKGVGPIASSQNRWMSGLHKLGLWKSAEGRENESIKKQMPGAKVLQLTSSQEELFLKNNPGLLEAVNNIESSTGAYARIVQKPDGRIVIGMFDPDKNSFIRIFDPQEMRSEKGLGMNEDRIVQGLLDE